jgi:hypothetical protein
MQKEGVTDERLIILFNAVAKYAEESTDPSSKPWLAVKSSLGDLCLIVVGCWKTTEFSTCPYQLEEVDEVTLPAHFPNQLRRVTEEQACNIQRVLQIAFNIGRAIQHKLIPSALTLDDFVKLSQ